MANRVNTGSLDIMPTLISFSVNLSFLNLSISHTYPFFGGIDMRLCCLAVVLDQSIKRSEQSVLSLRRKIRQALSLSLVETRG